MDVGRDHVPQIRVRGDAVEVQGASSADVQLALDLLGRARVLQHEQSVRASDQVLRAVMAASGIDFTPPAAVEQARRQADLRSALLTTPVYTYETLREVRGDAKASSTRTWVSRARGKQALFTVNVAGQTLIPAFQLTENAELRPELASLLRPLLGGGLTGWALWIWLTHPSPLLSGEAPAKVLETNPVRAEQAAKRFASRQRSAA